MYCKTFAYWLVGSHNVPSHLMKSVNVCNMSWSHTPNLSFKALTMLMVRFLLYYWLIVVPLNRSVDTWCSQWQLFPVTVHLTSGLRPINTVQTQTQNTNTLHRNIILLLVQTISVHFWLRFKGVWNACVSSQPFPPSGVDVTTASTSLDVCVQIVSGHLLFSFICV